SAWDDVVRILDAERQRGHAFLVAGLPYDEMREAVPPLINQIRDGARRIDRIIADLKDFARPGPRVRMHVKLNDVVAHVVRLLRQLIHQRTDRFELVLESTALALYGDPQQVEQVVVNLVINALEALPDRTRGVTVTTARDLPANTVVFEVRDEGV